MVAPNEVAAGALPPHVSMNDIRELNRLAELSSGPALRQALSIVRRLAGDFASLIANGISSATDLGRGGGPQIVQHLEGRAGRWWLGFFLWVPGAATQIHDHTSWGIYSCAGGTLLEERYRRLDDGAQPNRAHLRLRWRRWWDRGESSSLLPYAGGIHRVANMSTQPAWSVHLYGPRCGEFDGRDYEPDRDYVCDRRER